MSRRLHPVKGIRILNLKARIREEKKSTILPTGSIEAESPMELSFTYTLEVSGYHFAKEPIEYGNTGLFIRVRYSTTTMSPSSRASFVYTLFVTAFISDTRIEKIIHLGLFRHGGETILKLHKVKIVPKYALRMECASYFVGNVSFSVNHRHIATDQPVAKSRRTQNRHYIKGYGHLLEPSGHGPHYSRKANWPVELSMEQGGGLDDSTSGANRRVIARARPSATALQRIRGECCRRGECSHSFVNLTRDLSGRAACWLGHADANPLESPRWSLPRPTRPRPSRGPCP